MSETSDYAEKDKIILSVIKLTSILLLFFLVIIIGTLPLRVRNFKLNKILVSFMGAFSGGLFLSVGLILLIPSATIYFSEYFNDQRVRFPYAYLVCLLSFSLIMFVEKIAPDHQDYQQEEIKSVINDDLLMEKVDFQKLDADNSSTEKIELGNEYSYKKTVSTQLKVAKKIGFVVAVKQSMLANPSQANMFKEVNTWSPYLLQLGLGIHSIFEGLALGISQNIPNCVGLAIVILCHKWIEGLTLGYAFRQAKVKKGLAQRFIAVQAFMDPIGISIGWALANQGPLIKGILYAISAGTFLYLSSVEILQDEFNISRVRWQKYIICLGSIGLVVGIFLVEQIIKQ